MPSRKNEFQKGRYYHIYNRGVNREKIFFSEENYLYCLELIGKYYKQYSISLIAYCLMPNHYHFLLKQDSERSISDFTGVVFNAYVQAVNKQLNRTGTLFEGRFQHVPVDQNNYMVHLCRYIHINPVEANLVKTPKEWPYSNYREWIGLRNGKLVDRNFIAMYFQSSDEYRKFVMEYEPDEAIDKELHRYLLKAPKKPNLRKPPGGSKPPGG